MDLAGLVILAVLVIIYVGTIMMDAKSYSEIDPMPNKED